MDAATLTKLILHGKQFKQKLDHTAETLKTTINQDLDKVLDEFTDDSIQKLLIENKEFRKIAEGSKEDQDKFLSDLRKHLSIEKSTEQPSPILPLPPTSKPKIPSAEEKFEEMKKTKYGPKTGSQTRISRGEQTVSKSKQKTSEEIFEELQKYKHGPKPGLDPWGLSKPSKPLHKQAAEDTPQTRPDKAQAFLVDCTMRLMEEKGLSYEEAKAECQNFLEAQAHEDREGALDRDYDKLPGAEKIFEKLKKKHWLEGSK